MEIRASYARREEGVTDQINDLKLDALIYQRFGSSICPIDAMLQRRKVGLRG